MAKEKPQQVPSEHPSKVLNYKVEKNSKGEEYTISPEGVEIVMNSPNEAGGFTPLPKSIEFYVNGKGDVMSRGRDGRVLPIKHELVKATLFEILSRAKVRYAKSWELDGYIKRCMTKAIRESMKQANAKDEVLESQPSVLAILGMMILRHKNKLGPFVGNQSQMRKELEAICEANGLPKDELPKVKEFQDYLLAQKQLLADRNLSVSFKRRGVARAYTVAWIDEKKIPKWKVEPPVTRSDAKQGGVASQGAQSEGMSIEDALALQEKEERERQERAAQLQREQASQEEPAARVEMTPDEQDQATMALREMIGEVDPPPEDVPNILKTEEPQEETAEE